MDDYAFVYSQGHVYHLLVAAQDLPLVFANEEKNLALFDNSPPNIATIFWHVIGQFFKFKSNLPLRTATKRRHETLAAAARIHGGSENNPTPALDGMFDTLNKRC